MLSFYTFATRKPALPHYLPDFIGRLLVIRAGNQMSASQTLAFLLHICFLLANPRFRAPCPISSGVCSLFVPENQMSASQTLAFPLHIYFLLANLCFRTISPISSGVCSLFVPENQMSASQTLAFPLHEYIVPQRAAYHYPKIAFYRLSCAFMLSAESVSLSVISICSMLSVIMLIL